MRMPTALLVDDPSEAATTLKRYFGDPYPGNAYTGALFDSWDSTGTRTEDLDTFTADDFVAITLLNVDAGGRAARHILRDKRTEFNTLLTAIGPDRHLADEPGPIDNTWPAWQLETALRTVPGIGITIATKLIARKRPRLYPIWDTVVTNVLGTQNTHLIPIHGALRDNSQLRRRLVQARAAAALPEHITELRILDVLAWMQGTTQLTDRAR